MSYYADFDSGTASTTATTATIWYLWNAVYSATTVSAGSTDTAWMQWSSDYAATIATTSTTGSVWLVPTLPTPEELQEQARLAREREETLLRQAAEQNRIAREA